ncbi:MAG: hypothetical protein IJ615_04360 [Bacteroidaceae bacterium]|nr:hypothetical protein [Bacteroidaceae bacterium]
METNRVEQLCIKKEQELLNKAFGNIVHEAAIQRPETIGTYTKDLPVRIAAKYKSYLEELWHDFAPDDMKGTPLILEEEKLRQLMTGEDWTRVEKAFADAEEQTVWEFITQTNHKDVAYYKGLLQDYTRNLLSLMRLDFLEEITGHYIRNKTFEAD